MIDWIWTNPQADNDEESPFGWNDTFESEPDSEDML